MQLDAKLDDHRLFLQQQVKADMNRSVAEQERDIRGTNLNCEATVLTVRIRYTSASQALTRSTWHSCRIRPSYFPGRLYSWSFQRQETFKRLIHLAHSQHVSLKILAAGNMRFFLSDFPDLEEAAIDAIYDLCEDSSSRVRLFP